MKVRIDKLLVERGLALSRERAQALVLAGRVLVNGQKVEKAGAGAEEDAEIRLLGEDLPYVGLAGVKWEAPPEHWHIDLPRPTSTNLAPATTPLTHSIFRTR